MERYFITVKKRRNQSWPLHLTCLFIGSMILFLSINTSLFTHNNGIPPFTRSYSNSFTHIPLSSFQAKNDSSSTQLFPTTKPDPCRNRYIYIHALPKRFNTDILRDCKSLSKWSDMCGTIGLGPRVRSPRGPNWFATNQFSLEVIFHNRMKKYECLTDDSSLASLVYAPYYAGLDVGRYLFGDYNATVKDKLSLDFVKWVAERPQWRTMSGRDHFLVVARDGWDLNRKNTDWGNQFLLLPQTKNMSVLIIEATSDGGEIAVPYPSYFHPSHEAEVFSWQKKVRLLKRRFLYSFVGGPRPNQDSSIRGHIIRQCTSSKRKCKFLNCSEASCENVVNVMETMESSTFCLQPSGDSYTRRSTFDSILAGCIPVFFHQASAYTQYKWHLPDNYTTYSVFIPEGDIKEGKANIEKVLSRIPKKQVAAMRKEVVRLIPKVTYAVSKLETIEDAFDIAIDRLLDKVNDARELVESENDFQ